MKKLIILALLIVAIGAKAQTTKITSYLGDQIYLPKGAAQLTPIIVTSIGDTARSMIWYTGPISRDSTATTIVSLTFYDRNANNIGSVTRSITESTYTKWTVLFNAIDAYIHNQIPRIVLH